MTDGSTPHDPWRKDGAESQSDGREAAPTTAHPVPGPFPAGGFDTVGPAHPGVNPDAPAWARQAHAQGSHQPPPTSQGHPSYGTPPPSGPDQQYPGQAYPGQPYPAQQFPGQQYPGQPYPGQAYPAQPYPPQPYPGRPAGDGGPTQGFAQPVFPPTAQQQPYQQPGYLPPGYRPMPPTGGPYAPGGQPPAGYPGGPYGSVKPGAVTGAAVLAFIQGGLLVFAGIITLSGVSALADLDVVVGRANTGVITVMGVLALVAAGLLIAGGVLVHQRKPRLLVVGAALSLLLSVWWAIQFEAVSGALTFAVMPIISLSLVLGATTRQWTDGNPPS